jgi:hypothetical protein
MSAARRERAPWGLPQASPNLQINNRFRQQTRRPPTAGAVASVIHLMKTETFVDNIRYPVNPAVFMLLFNVFGDPRRDAR